jgi:hypothetical protein
MSGPPTNALRAALDQLERRLRDFDAPIIEHLQPGLSPGEVDAVLQRCGLAAPEELTSLWEWHDGTDSDRYEHSQLVGHWHLVSLERAARHHAEHRDIYDNPLADPGGYPRGWFPTLLYWDGPFAAIDCKADTAEKPLYIVDPNSDPPDAANPDFPSLRYLIEAFNSFFDLGLVERDEKRGGATVPWERIPEELRHISYW